MTLAALLCFAVAGLALAWAEDRLHRLELEPLAAAWVEHFLLPLGRVFSLMLFLLVAYPALFGVRSAPSLGTLLFGTAGRIDHLINVLFFAGLLLPSLPVLRRLPGLTLPLQGMAGTALLFTWLAQALGATHVRLLPDAGQALLLAALAALAVASARLLTITIEEPVVRQDAQDLILLWMQALPLLVYARMLGAQLAA